ncbi:MAG TPA: TAXI family TRAP transporter solute-binding subunit [Sulfolobales archaeon]|nr:TAXI family TRAP transporter solute-binding subunit [Sulfolobales archaeon]
MLKGLSKTALYVVIAVIVIAIIAGFIAYNQLAGQAGQAVKYRVVIATGGVGGVYYYYGATVAGIISNYTDISATSIQTAASIDNLLLIRDKTDLANGIIYCATVLPDSAYLAYTGQHDRFRNATAPISILWAMYPNYLHIVTTADKGIKTLQDLKGKRVSTGAPSSGTEVEALLLLRIIGIDPSKDFSKWERLGAEESANALRDGTIDAYFWSGGVPTGSIVELSKTLAQRGLKIYLVPVTDDVINEFSKRYPGIAAPGTIPKSVYGTDSDTQTLSFWNMFVCHKDTPPDVAYKITKAVFEHLDLLQRAVAPARDTTPQNAVKYMGGTIPYNEGALKYYKEIGVIK